MSGEAPPVKRGRKANKTPGEQCLEVAQKIKKEPAEGAKRGRKPKKQTDSLGTYVKNEPLDEYGDKIDVKQRKITDMLPVKKKRDRFKGLTEEEVLCRTLPDHVVPDLDILIIGINPGLTAAFVGHHYAGPGNHFWKCLYLSGLTPEQMNAYDDFKLKEYGIGFTNIVERTSRGSADLTKKEIKEGAEILAEKIRKYKPKIAAFNGKGIYEVFCGHKNFYIGKQPEPFPDTDTVIFVMPSSSARFTQLPRAVDKVPFYVALKKLRDHLRGALPDLNEAEVTFPDLELKVEPKKERLEVKQEIDTAGEASGAVSPTKRRVKKEPRSPPVKTELDSSGEPPVAVAKGRKRRSKKSAEAADVVQEEPLNLKSPYFHSGLPTVKTEPVTELDCYGSAFNGHFNGFVGNSSNMQVPLLPTAFTVKEEIPHDLSQYGIMPSSSGFGNIGFGCYPDNSLHQRPEGRLLRSGVVPPGSVPFVSTSVTPWTGMNLVQVFGNPHVSQAINVPPSSNNLTQL